MYPSASVCRSQQALQLARAASATLINVRSIPETVAAAWGDEAVQAEKRELRLAKAARPTLLARNAKDDRDRGLSENPDRSFADA